MLCFMVSQRFELSKFESVIYIFWVLGNLPIFRNSSKDKYLILALPTMRFLLVMSTNPIGCNKLVFCSLICILGCFSIY